MNVEHIAGHEVETASELLSPHQVLYDALQSCYTDLTKHKAEFQRAAEKTLAAVPPDEHAPMMTHINALHWRYFGGFGSRLPEGLRIGPRNEVIFDRAKVSVEDANTCEILMGENGLSALDQSRAASRMTNKDAIMGPLLDVIRHTDVFCALQAFDIRDPAQTRERPLNCYERLAYQARLQEDIWRGYQLPPAESLRSDGGAFVEWKGGVGRLEILSVDSHESRAVARPIEILRGEMVDQILQNEQGLTNEKVSIENLNMSTNDMLIEFAYHNAEGKLTERRTQGLNDIADALADSMRERLLGDGSNYMDICFTAPLMKKVVERVFLPEADSTEYSTWLNECAALVAQSWFWIGNGFDKSEALLNPYMMGMYRPRPSAYDMTAYDSDTVTGPALNRKSYVELGDKASYKQELKQRLGTVEVRSSAKDGVTRIIESHRRSNNYDDADFERADIVLHLTEEWSTSEEPFIRGYKLQGHDAQSNAFTFVKDPLGDPAVVKEVALDEERIPALVRQYDELGLAGLANYLKRQTNPTIETLEAMIKYHTAYVMPQQAGIEAQVGNLQDFEQFVQNGGLRVQCDVANEFLVQSVNAALGRRVMRVIDGIPFGGKSQKLKGVPHAQAVYEEAGYMRLYDATPIQFWPLRKLGQLLAPLRRRPEGNPFFDPEAEKRIAATAANVGTIAAPLSSVQAKIEVTQNAIAAKYGLERALCERFEKADTEALYTFLQQDPAYYPIYKTIQLIGGAIHSGTDIKNKLAEHLTFLSNIKTATLDERRQWGYGEYNRATLDFLIGHTTQLYEKLD